MYTASVQSSSISMNPDLERYQERRKAERELYGAIDLLNTLMSGINLIQKFRMVDENQAVLVDIKTNDIIRSMSREEVLVISNSLKKSYLIAKRLQVGNSIR